MKSQLEQRFGMWWIGLKGPDLNCEYRFHAKRKWRFDFAHVPTKTAIELEGGVWINGAHTRGKGFRDDCLKYNEAQFDGWTIFRITVDMISVPLLERIIVHIRSKEAKRGVD